MIVSVSVIMRRDGTAYRKHLLKEKERLGRDHQVPVSADGGGDRRPATGALCFATGILSEPADCARGTDKWSDCSERHVIEPESLEQSSEYRI